MRGHYTLVSYYFFNIYKAGIIGSKSMNIFKSYIAILHFYNYSNIVICFPIMNIIFRKFFADFTYEKSLLF